MNRGEGIGGSVRMYAVTFLEAGRISEYTKQKP
jgi:hypothetical protein